MASERPEVVGFFSARHRDVFKPRGFVKSRRTFSKATESYVVSFNFQGSQWNSAGTPWRFYLNVGIRFPNLPLQIQKQGFADIHAESRVGRALSSWAEPHFDVPENQQVLVGTMAAIVDDCLRYFAAQHDSLRRRYQEKPTRYLGYLDSALLE